MNQEELYAKRMTRGILLTHLYVLQDKGLCDPSTPRTATRLMIEGLKVTGMLPPEDMVISALQWLEAAGYIEMDWALDDHTGYQAVTITQEGVNLYEDKEAVKKEPQIFLQPRR